MTELARNSVTLIGVKTARAGGLLRVGMSRRLWRIVQETFALGDLHRPDTIAAVRQRRAVRAYTGTGGVIVEAGSGLTVLRAHAERRAAQAIMLPQLERSPSDGAFEHLTRRATRAVEAGSVERAEEAVIELLGHLTSSYSRSRASLPPAPPWLGHVLGYLQANFTEKISLADLGAVAGGRSRFHVTRTYRSVVGMTPSEHLLTMRVAHAGAHLAMRVSACVEAAAACGFYDQSHLHRNFVQILGLTPGEWARETSPRVDAR
jgi:AraC-like DNA-binding protein